MEETFGQRFTRLRKEKGLTQEEVANRLHVSAQAVSKWETGSSLPDLGLVGTIVDLFQITIDELLGREGKVTTVGKELTDEETDSKLLKVRVLSSDGDTVKINLPIGVLRIMLKSGSSIDVSGNKALENIDFKQIIALVKKGVIGDLVSVHSAEGDVVTISVD
jgi:transcriptional regulator with XRE-family HTH domain